MRIKSGLLSALMLTLAVTANASPAQGACGPGMVPTYQDIEALRYVRTNCFGECPSYQVLFTRFGGCYYIGFDHVPKHGTYKNACSSTVLKQTILVLENHEFYKLQYDTSELVSDVPHYIASVERCGVTTILNWPEHGQRKDIEALFDGLDKITDHLRWHKVSGSLESPLALLAAIP